MVWSDYTWIVVIGALAAFSTAFGIGANDVANAFGSSVAARTLTMRQALLVAAVCEFGGSVLLGAEVTRTVAGGIARISVFDQEPEIYMYGMLCAMVASGTWLLIATYLSLPVSTTHATIGAVLGFAFVYGGSHAIVWLEPQDDFPYVSGLVPIIMAWFTSPLLSGLASVVFFLLVRTAILRRERSMELAIWSLPVLVLFTVFINLFFVLYKGSEARLAWDSNRCAWVSAVAATGCAVLTGLVGVPLVRSRVYTVAAGRHRKQMDAQLKLAHGSVTSVPGGTSRSSHLIPAHRSSGGPSAGGGGSSGRASGLSPIASSGGVASGAAVDDTGGGGSGGGGGSVPSRLGAHRGHGSIGNAGGGGGGSDEAPGFTSPFVDNVRGGPAAATGGGGGNPPPRYGAEEEEEYEEDVLPWMRASQMPHQQWGEQQQHPGGQWQQGNWQQQQQRPGWQQGQQGQGQQGDQQQQPGGQSGGSEAGGQADRGGGGEGAATGAGPPSQVQVAAQQQEAQQGQGLMETAAAVREQAGQEQGEGTEGDGAAGGAGGGGGGSVQGTNEQQGQVVAHQGGQQLVPQQQQQQGWQQQQGNWQQQWAQQQQQHWQQQQQQQQQHWGGAHQQQQPYGPQQQQQQWAQQGSQQYPQGNPAPWQQQQQQQYWQQQQQQYGATGGATWQPQGHQQQQLYWQQQQQQRLQPNNHQTWQNPPYPNTQQQQYWHMPQQHPQQHQQQHQQQPRRQGPGPIAEGTEGGGWGPSGTSGARGSVGSGNGRQERPRTALPQDSDNSSGSDTNHRREQQVQLELEQQQRQQGVLREQHQGGGHGGEHGGQQQHPHQHQHQHGGEHGGEQHHQQQHWQKTFDQLKAIVLHGTSVNVHDCLDPECPEADPVAAAVHAHAEVFDPSTEHAFKYLQVVTAICDSFSHGANDVANSVGPFAAIWYIFRHMRVDVNSTVPVWILVLGGAGIVVGLGMYGYNIIRAMGVRLSAITPSRGFCIELSTALVVVLASKYGLPVSTTHCQVGATAGMGLLEGAAGLNWPLCFQFLLGWLVTLCFTGLLSAAIFAAGVYAPSMQQGRAVLTYQRALGEMAARLDLLVNRTNTAALSDPATWGNFSASLATSLAADIATLQRAATPGSDTATRLVQYEDPNTLTEFVNRSVNTYLNNSLPYIGGMQALGQALPRWP